MLIGRKSCEKSMAIRQIGGIGHDPTSPYSEDEEVTGPVRRANLLSWMSPAKYFLTKNLLQFLRLSKKMGKK